MIIFDLDGTLADCEHRRHFVDVHKAVEKGIAYEDIDFNIGGIQSNGFFLENDRDRRWKPDWTAFFEACDKDTPIEPVLSIFSKLWIGDFPKHVEIWSGRCESVKEKTFEWLCENWFINLFDHEKLILKSILKMRPIGDYTPDDELKEKWLDEAIAQGKTIEAAFDDRPKVVRMWRRRGIFVFDVNQTGAEF